MRKLLVNFYFVKFLLIYSFAAQASNVSEQAKIYDQSKAIANQSLNQSFAKLAKSEKESAQNNFFKEIIQNDEARKFSSSALDNLPQKGESLRESQQGEFSCSKASCNTSGVFSTESINKKQAKMELLGFRKNSANQIENSKGYLDKANKQVKDAIKNQNNISGEFEDCNANEHELLVKEQNECDLYLDVKHENCLAEQVVEIDPKYKYVCTKKRAEFEKFCYEEVASISCKKTKECDNGGIILTSVKSDMKWEYNYPYLTVGTIADNYWRGWCNTYDRLTEFEVRNKDKISEFLLTEVGFDDYLWIKLNGHTVYVGPGGGNKVEAVGGKVDNGLGGVNACERNTNWYFANLDIDLKPYLREGRNELFMRVIVSGAGEGWMRIRAKQHCCLEWDVNYKQECKIKG